jgi:hypothetical protein
MIGSLGTGIGAEYAGPMHVMGVSMPSAKELGVIPGKQITGIQAAEWRWANWPVSAPVPHDELREMARCFPAR